ncbi:MAG: hypothetical protein HC897_00535 [Thermoanaerobaculia bacterium]|nr:hypothetical protein [Thermoanaerobaculia bacterium]
MRPKALTRIAAAISLTLFLPQLAPVHACPPQPIGLEALIERSDQAILVEVTAIDLTPAARLSWTALQLQRLAISASEVVSEDLALILSEVLPGLPQGFDQPVFSVTSRVLSQLEPHGPRIGSTFRWPLDDGYPWGVVPGGRAVVFLVQSQSLPDRVRLTPIPAPDAVLALGEHEDADQLAEVIRDGFANKRRGGTIATDEWLERALRSPVSRGFLSLDRAIQRLPPEVLADALAREPGGSYHDLALLRHLRAVRDFRLDLLALELTQCWLETNLDYLAQQAMQIAIERWQIPTTPRLEAALDTRDGEPARLAWREIAQEMALPMATDPRLCAVVGAMAREHWEARDYYARLAEIWSE